MMPAEPPVWVLAGPTASGKTALALALARRLPIEIISMDSALVYRGMDIGTAKPDPAERALAPHHLLDVRDPCEPYSAADFVSDASRLIAEIRARGSVPIIAGGTMLYLHALAHGLGDLPRADAQVRARIAARANLGGWQALHAELAAIDPETAARLEPADTQRVQRALEVFELSGKPLSAHFRAQQGRRARSGPALRVLALEPSDRSMLHQRIASRFDTMLAAGFLAEVDALRARGDLHPGLPSMRAVGYRQAWIHLDGETDAATFRAQAIAATRQLAKRQLTWLRSMPDRLVVDCCDPEAIGPAMDTLLQGR